MTEPGRTLFKVRVPRTSNSLSGQLVQLACIFGLLLAVIGALAAGQYFFCVREFPKISLAECLSVDTYLQMKKSR